MNMSGKMPVIKQIGWLSIIPQLLFMGLLIFFYFLLGIKEYFLFGVFTYIIISFTLRNTITIEHRKGIKNYHKQNYNDAILNFQNSLDFFKKHEWIDKYRYLVLLSSSKYSYREMALCNIAFCYGQIGEGKKAEYYYNVTLQEFPNNNLARSSLNIINSVKQNEE